MSESKIELNARKIRNGIRKELEARQKKLWDTLSTEYTPPPFTVTFRMGPYNVIRDMTSDDLSENTFDIVFDEFTKDDD